MDIKLLHDTSDSIVDIIFVHELGGHRVESWKPRNATDPWPQTLLPPEVPYARILTVGHNFWFQHGPAVSSKTTIKSYSQRLLEEVAWYRWHDKTSNRAIIFVAHGLGGLLVESALLDSGRSAREDIRDVLQSTRGIIFFGTPQHGADLARWAEMLVKSIHVPWIDPPFLEKLKLNSDTLADIQKRFNELIEKHQEGLEITCFYEELSLDNVGLVVPKNEAMLGDHTLIGIQSDHFNMTKFGHKDDPGFRAVAGELRRWSKKLAQARISDEGTAIPMPTAQSLRAPSRQVSGSEASNRKGHSVEDPHATAFTTGAPRSETEATPLLSPQRSNDIPNGSITELSPGKFRVITKGCYGHVFEDTIHVPNREDAVDFFWHMNNYDPSRRLPFLYPQWVYNFIWTFSPPKVPKALEASEAPFEDAGSSSERWSSPPRKRGGKGKEPMSANDLEIGKTPSDSPIVSSSHGEGLPAGSSGPDARQAKSTSVTSATDPQPRGPDLISPGTSNPPNVGISYYICVATGHKQPFTLYHSELSPELLQLEDELAADKRLFEELRGTVYEILRPSLFRQVMFPLHISRVEYWEFSLWGEDRVDLPKDWLSILPDDEGVVHEQASPNRNQGTPTSTNKSSQSCPIRRTVGWRFTSKKDEPDIRLLLSWQRLTTYLLNPGAVDPPAKGYAAKWIPRRENEELTTEGQIHVHGWGLVVRQKFDYLTFVLIWTMIAFLVAAIVILVLVRLGPLRGNVTGMFSIIFGFVGLVNILGLTVSVNHARSEELY